ncbi:MAG: glycoside hydrolase family 2 TIM barrel-domain containing protein [Rikenellaceae bacterium]
MKKLIYLSIFMLFALASCTPTVEPSRELFNTGWKFSKLSKADEENRDYGKADFNAQDWESVQLPHTANLEPLIVNDQWQGICWYRKDFDVKLDPSKSYILEFEGAMNQIEVMLNGEKVFDDQGGYLPMVMDLTSYLKSGKNTIAVRLNNYDNAETGPKPLEILDFNMFGGLYRNAWMIVKNKVRISHPILAGRAAEGGTFVTYPAISKEKATVKVAVDVENVSEKAEKVVVETVLTRNGAAVVSAKSASVEVAAGKYSVIPVTMDVASPALWSLDNPNLYTLATNVYNESGELIDTNSERIGIRSFKFNDNQLYINGEKTFLRGVNRHQEYPYIGYALSDNAQYRDAKKIKDAGFDYVRLSHYPHSKAFMNACDELGLVVLDAILGWQFYKDNDAFRNECYDSARNLIRRDRNHACVLAWEVSLNETQMPVFFMEELHRITHEEYPGEETYSCGWMSGVYDIYLQARQHRIMHSDKVTFEWPYIVSEYGDWEYYSTNAGLNQHQYDTARRLELSSRQRRGDGEERQLVQALNFQESHNDNLSIPAMGDSYWVMYDYNRGYHDDLETSGVLDIFRLPKFGADFYRSQRSARNDSEYMVSIASWWNEDSSTDIRVFSNCETVTLSLNGKVIATKKPDTDKISKKLNHPPFTFKVGKFAAGELKAIGYKDGKEMCQVVVRTPEAPVKLRLRADISGRDAQSGCNDVLFVYAEAVDANGTVVPSYNKDVTFTLPVGVVLENTDGIHSEAGVAIALIRLDNVAAGALEISAKDVDGLSGSFTLDVN